MKNKISLNEFAFYVASAKRKHPNAKVFDVGERYVHDQWYFVLYLEIDGKDMVYLIPETSKK